MRASVALVGKKVLQLVPGFLRAVEEAVEVELTDEGGGLVVAKVAREHHLLLTLI